MGYTGVHYAVKDSASAAGLLLQVIFWIAVGVIFLIVVIPVLLIWGIVALVQYLRHRGETRRAELTRQSPTGQEREAGGCQYGLGVVDAVQWTGVKTKADDNLAAVKSFLGDQFCGVLGPPISPVIAFTGTTTSAPVGIAELGQWIVRSDEGLAAMADAQFRATYEYFDETSGFPDSRKGRRVGSLRSAAFPPTSNSWKGVRHG